MENLTQKEIKSLNDLKTPTQGMQFGGIIAEIITLLNLLDSERFIEEGTPVNAAKAKVSFTITDQPTAGNKVIIGPTEYTFVANGATPDVGDIVIGTLLADTQAAIVEAIKGLDTVNPAHDQVTISSFAADVAVVTALTGGVWGNTVNVSTDEVNASFLDGATTLEDGADATQGTIGLILIDASWLYVFTTDQTWRRISLGSAY